MNDWEIGKFLQVILVMQLAVCVAVALDIPIVRQIVGFIYLSFIPGVVLLRILRVHKTNVVETILLSVGLSIAFLSLIGLLVNSLYPIFGIMNPLSPVPVIATVSVATMILCALAYYQDESISRSCGKDSWAVSSFGRFTGIALLGIPLLSILGTRLVANSRDNSILLLLFIVIPLFIILATCSKKLIPAETFPWIVLAIAVALLFCVSLISPYLVGYDVHLESNFLNLTLLRSSWDASIPNNYNAMLSVTILPAMYSQFMNLDGIWIFKIAYLLIFSLVPVALFQTYQKQTTPLIALLSAFLLMSQVQFYLDMQGLARQMIAELFLALLLLLVVDKKMDLQKRRSLSLIFGAGLVVSHYAVAYIFMFFLVFVWFLSLWMKDDRSQNQTINTTYIVVFCVMLLSWYTFVASSEATLSIVELIKGIPAHIVSGFGGGVAYLSPTSVSFMHEISKYVFYVIQVFIVIGVIAELLRYRESKFNRYYFLMSLISLGVLLICIFFPYVAESLKVSRVYHLMLLFLAPYCILGGITTIGLIAKLVSGVARFHWNEDLKLLPVYLVIILFFLLQSGFLHEVFRDSQPTSMPLSGYRADPVSNWGLYAPYTREQEVTSARWLSRNMGNEWKTYADVGSMYGVLTSYGMIPTQYVMKREEYVLKNTTKTIPEGAYIYLRYINVQGKMQSVSAGLWDTQDISNLTDSCNKIYSNGESVIYMRATGERIEE